MGTDGIIKGILFLILITGVCLPVFSYVLVGVLIVLIILIKKEQEIVAFFKENPTILCLVLIMFIASIFSEMSIISIFYSLFFILKVIYSAITALYFNKRDIKNAIAILLILGIIVSMTGFFQFFIKAPLMPNSWVDKSIFKINFRVYSTFYNPNILSVFLNLIIIISIVFMENKPDIKMANLSIISAVVSFLCSLLTYSRAGWIALCISVLSLSLFNKRYFKYFVILLIGVLSFDLLNGIGRLSLHKIKVDSTIQYRFNIWKATLKIIKDNIIVGVGPGVIWDYIPKYSNDINAYVAHTHNLFLQIISDIGIIGFIVFINFIMKTWLLLKQGFSSSQFVSLISTISYTFYVSLLVHGLFDAVSLQPQISLYIWLFLGFNYSLKKEMVKYQASSSSL